LRVAFVVQLLNFEDRHQGVPHFMNPFVDMCPIEVEM
jgi:hypothetical protein